MRRKRERILSFAGSDRELPKTVREYREKYKRISRLWTTIRKSWTVFTVISRSSRREAAMGERATLEERVETLAVPRRMRDLADAVMSTWQSFRAGIEGTISGLKRAFRLARRSRPRLSNASCRKPPFHQGFGAG